MSRLNGRIPRTVTRLVVVAVITMSVGLGCGQSERPETGSANTSVDQSDQSALPDEQSISRDSAGSSGALLASAGSLDSPVGRPREIWRISHSAPVTASPVVADGVVAAAFADYVVRALDAQVGDEIWSFESSQLVTDLEAARGVGGLFVTGTEETLLLDTGDGEVVWSGGPPAAPGGELRSTTRALYLPAADGTLVALEPQSGDELWSTDPDPSSQGHVTGMPAALDGVLYVSLSDGGLSAVRATDGELLWRQEIARTLVAGPLATAAGVYAASPSGEIFHLDRQDGSVSGYVADGPTPILTTAPLEAGSSVLVYDAAGRLYAVPPAGSGSARVVGEGSLASFLCGQPGFLDTVVLAADASGSLNGITPETGRRQWSFPVGIRLTGGLAYASGSIFLAGSEGTLLALVLDVPADSTPLLTADRPVEIPENGEFRMKQRFVDLQFVPGRDGVYEFTVESDDAADELILAVMDEEGTVLATNMGKVTLGSSARARLDSDSAYLLRLERSYPDESPIVTLSSELVE